jgi:hypothetical protein
VSATILSPPEVIINSWQSLYLKTSVELGCLSQTQNVIYSWTLWEQASTVYTEFAASAYDYLYIPPNIFPPGGIIKVEFAVSLNGSLVGLGKDVVSIFVLPKGNFATIRLLSEGITINPVEETAIWPHQFSISRRSQIELDATPSTKSFHDDTLYFEEVHSESLFGESLNSLSNKYLFQWDCRSLIPPRCGFCMDEEARIAYFGPKDDEKAVVSIPASTLQPGKYEFSLVVKDNSTGTSDTSKIIVDIIGEHAPNVVILPISKGKVNAEEKLILVGDASWNSVNNLEFFWSATVEGQLHNVAVDLDPAKFKLSSDNKQLLIRQNSLSPKARYSFLLESSSADSEPGNALISFQVNSPPTSGVFIVEPKDGFSSFSVACYGWEDDPSDYPLRYAFYYKDSSNQEIPLTLSAGLINRAIVQLPSDASALVSYVIDSYGSKSRNEVPLNLPLQNDFSKRQSRNQTTEYIPTNQLTLAEVKYLIQVFG